jgi:hypothetical protein
MIIGLYSSAPRMGKTTLANYLSKNHGFLKLSFASALKAMMQTFLSECGYPRKEIKEIMVKHKDEPFAMFDNQPFRKGLQTLGTEWGRSLSLDLWVHVMKNKLKIFEDRNIVIDDMRFPNEFNLLRDKGALLVKVERPGVYYNKIHSSEGALDDFPFHLIYVNSLSKVKSGRKFWEEVRKCGNYI